MFWLPGGAGRAVFQSGVCGSWIQRFAGGPVGDSGGVERWHSSPIGVGCCGSNIEVNDYTL